MKFIHLCFVFVYILILGCVSEAREDDKKNVPPNSIIILNYENDGYNVEPLTSCWLSDPREVSAYARLNRFEDEWLNFTCDNGKRHNKVESSFIVDEFYWLDKNEDTTLPNKIYTLSSTYNANNGFPLSSLKKEVLVTLRQASDGKWYVRRWLEVSSSTSSLELETGYRDYRFPTSWTELVDEVTSQHSDYESLCGASSTRTEEEFEALLFQPFPGHCNITEPPPEVVDDGTDNN
jgi:hypothetical protein